MFDSYSDYFKLLIIFFIKITLLFYLDYIQRNKIIEMIIFSVYERRSNQLKQ